MSKQVAVDGSQALAERVAGFIAERDALARLLGIELVEVRPGYSRACLQLTPDMLNLHGIPHGAAVFAVADVAFAAAANSHGVRTIALNADIHYLRPADPDALLEAEAEEVKRGRRTAVYRITVRQAGGPEVAVMHGMAYVQGDRFLEQGERQALAGN